MKRNDEVLKSIELALAMMGALGHQDMERCEMRYTRRELLEAADLVAEVHGKTRGPLG